MTTTEIKPSVFEVALRGKRALILGLGGGGDIIQGIPVARLCQLLGYEEIYMGGVACQWWMPDGKPQSDVDGVCVLGPTFYDVADLTAAETWGPQLRGVTKVSAVGACRPCEAVLAELLPGGRPFVAGLQGGSRGLAESLREFVVARKIDFVVGVDIGSDSFHRGDEVQKAHTSLADFLSIGALLDLPCPVFYGVAGYGCDGEMQISELDERVGIVMAHGGYLGAHGLTQGDVAAMLEAAEVYPDPVEPLSALAARGELGWRRVNTHGPWGTPVFVGPVAAVMMFFDPRVMAEYVSRGILALRETTSLAEAENIFREQLGELPESQLLRTVKYFR